MNTPCIRLLIVLLAWASTYGADTPTLDEARIAADAARLIAIPDRSMGSAGAKEAADWIASELTAAGLQPRLVRTTVSVAVDQGSTLRIGDATISLIPHRPARAATGGTAGQPLTGPLRFLGKGRPSDLAGKTIAGSIAVLDPDSDAAWTTVAELGALAVIIRDPIRIDRIQLAQQSATVSLELPRFVADVDQALDGQTATVTSTVRWEPRTAWSVIARIPGTGPKNEAVLLTAGYESPPDLTRISPGATRAWNAALLLEVARSFAAAPTVRDQVVIFAGARGEQLRGLRHLIASFTLDRKDGSWPADGQLVTLHNDAALQLWREKAMRDALAAAVAEGDPTLDRIKELAIAALGDPPVAGIDLETQKSLVGQRIEDFIGLQAGSRADELLRPLNLARESIAPRQRAAMQAADIERIQKQIADDDAVYQRYLTIQRRLAYAKELQSDEQPLVKELATAALPNLERHLATVAANRDDYASLVAAREVLGAAQPIHLIGLDLSDGGNRFSSTTRGPFVEWEEELGWLHSGLVKLVADLNQQAGGTPVAFERAARDAQDEIDAWFGTLSHEAGCAGMYMPAATLSTVNDHRIKLGSPADTAAAFASERFLAQARGLRRLLSGYIDAGFLANRKSKGLSSKAPKLKVEVRSIGTKTGRRGYPYPLAFIGRQPQTPIGDVGWYETAWGDTFGTCRVPFLSERNPALSNGLTYFAYGFTDQGAITAVLADSGQQRGASEYKFERDQLTDQLPLVFASTSSRLFSVFDPRLLIPLTSVNPLSATRDAPPDFAHIEMSRDLAAAAVFSEPGIRLRLTATQGQVGNRLVITGQAANEREHPEADAKQRNAGLAPGQLSALTALDGAEDMWHLNHDRLALLRRNGISSDSLVSLHSLAERELENARAAVKRSDWSAANGAAQSAWALSGRVYPSVLSTANDVVYGLVVMLLFSIPFAWVCERLFLAGNTIFKKLAGFAAVFVVTFLFFFFFHPAFALATTPMIIFLAFVIIIMSTWVISLIYNKFEQEMEAIRMSGMGMHKADVSRLGTLFATVSLGISNMRRRPMRTFLTAVTVVLMTFILLTFASFTPGVGSQRIVLDGAPAYQGILVRNNGWVEMSEQSLARIERTTSDRFSLHEVRWLAPTVRIPKYPLNGPAGIADVGGVVGVGEQDPSGIEQALVRGSGDQAPRGFGGETDWLFLPPDVLTRIGVRPGEPIQFKGLTLRAGVIETSRLSQLLQLGGDPLTPLAVDLADKNRVDENTRLASLAGDSAPPPESGSAIHISPAGVGIMHVDMAKRLGGTLRAIALHPRSSTLDIAKAADDLARELAVTLRVGAQSDSYLLTSVGRLSVAGLGAVLIPLILGGLIIFSTMLNSVAERGKEIFIYASLGLAPVHVAALFLVEASIYAVLGGLGGYMLAQLIASALGVAADMGYGVRPDLNYSSFTAVATILLVMATVLISALYPAMMASKAANPGTTDFRVPDPDGDLLEIAFPFTVSRRDVRGLCAFLAKYFDSHTEAAGGCFTAAEAGMVVDGDRCEVTAKVWLSPFDLGISQRFIMRAVPTDVKAIYSVQLSLELLSGQRAAWKRTNLAFLKDLRQQFLVWRTLAPETMDQYRADGGDEDAKRRIAEAAAAAAEAPAGAPA